MSHEMVNSFPSFNLISTGNGSELIESIFNVFPFCITSASEAKTPATAAFRAIGQEYVANEATVEPKTVKLAIFGGSFEIDRIIKTVEGQLNNMAFQLEQKISAAVGLFHNGMINGDTAKDANSFDGLDKFLVGTVNELNTDKVIDLSTMESLKANADVFYEALTSLINKTSAHALFVNEDMKTKIQTVARVLGYETASEEAFGRVVTSVNGVRIIDLGNVYDETGAKTPIINKVNRTVGTAQTGLTDVYAVKFDVNDGFHGVTITGNDVVQQYLPDFSQPGALKKGEVEMVACVALKNANNAGVLRNVKIA